MIELQDIDNVEVALLGVADQTVAADTVIPLVAHDIVGKLMIQCAREIPLSTCFGNLCCFDGSECYFETWPELTGTTFREACYCFNGDGTESNSGAVVMGVKFTDDYCREMALERPVQLNPPGDYVIRDGDKILVLAEDNDTYHAGTSNETPATPVPPFELPPPPPENILLCGWRRDFDDMIMELDKWVPAGSKLFLLNPLEDSSGEMDPVVTSQSCRRLELPAVLQTDYMKYLLEAGGFDQEDSQMENIESVEYMSGDPTNVKVC